MSDSRVIGSYRTIAGLGVGGMGRVYLAMSHKPGFDKLMVLKVLKDELAMDPEFLRMFLAEARVASRLNHPNVVHTYEIGAHEGDHFIAMEYLEGQSLASILQRVGRNAMPLPLHVRILREVLLGLHYAHELVDYDGTHMAIVHRDVSPQNVFVTYPGHVKLLDFGIAKVAGSATLTEHGLIKGKLGYMAPEQALSMSLDARADVFSVGVMLWEALAGRRLGRADEGEASVLRRRISGDEERVLDVRTDAPPELVAICEKAMAFERDQRFANAAEFEQALDRWLKATSNPDAREIARHVEEHFADDRSKIRRLVEEQSRRSPASAPLIMLELGPPLTPPSRSSLDTTLVHSDGSQVLGTPAPKRGRSRVRALAVAVSLAGLAVAFVSGRRSSVRATAASEVPAPLSAGGASETPAAAPGLVQTVRISVRVTPASARLLVDGQPMQLPFESARPRDDSTHRIEASAPGFGDQALLVSFDKDQALDLHLVPPDAGGRGNGRSRLPPSRRDPLAGATDPRPNDVELGQDARPIPKRTIDERDPY